MNVPCSDLWGICRTEQIEEGRERIEISTPGSVSTWSFNKCIGGASRLPHASCLLVFMYFASSRACVAQRLSAQAARFASAGGGTANLFPCRVQWGGGETTLHTYTKDGPSPNRPESIAALTMKTALGSPTMVIFIKATKPAHSSQPRASSNSIRDTPNPPSSFIHLPPS